MAHRTPARRSAASRRAGYVIAIVVNAVLLYLINVKPGWQVARFLTPATSQVLGIVNLALALRLAANVVYVGYDGPRLKALGDLITTAAGLAATIRVWQVFPFAFHGSAAFWSTVVRVLLIVGIVGSSIAIAVALVRLIRGTGRGVR